MQFSKYSPGAVVLLATLWLAACDNESTSNDVSSLDESIAAIHERILTIDTHVDIPLNFATEEEDPAHRPGAKVDLEKMEEGGLDVVFYIVYVGQTERTDENYAQAKADAMTKFDAIHRMTDEMYPDRIELAYSAADAIRISESGKLVAFIGIENGYTIGKDISLLEKYYDLGGRYMTLVHGGHNDIGDSATPRDNLDAGPEEHGGLSDFGLRVVDEMNRLGMMVDVSHVSRQTMLDATARSVAPIIASHSPVTSVADHPRNMNDEQLLALKANGGVIQIAAFDSYVKLVPPEKTAAREALMADLGIASMRDFASLDDDGRAALQAGLAEINEQFPGANVSDFVDHIDYAVELIGIDHVGISSDFDGGGGVIGWNSAAETMNVTAELVERSYSEEDIVKLWGGNLLRVLSEVERIAAELQARE